MSNINYPPATVTVADAMRAAENATVNNYTSYNLRCLVVLAEALKDAQRQLAAVGSAPQHPCADSSALGAAG